MYMWHRKNKQSEENNKLVKLVKKYVKHVLYLSIIYKRKKNM